MDLTLFVNADSGDLVRITGTDPAAGPWEHMAFRPAPLPSTEPRLSGRAYRRVAAARAALAGLDATARRLTNPRLLRTPALRREAHATSALEGTYAPYEDVLDADPSSPRDGNLREILNYVVMAEHAFDALDEGRPLSVGMLEELQLLLVRGTASGERNPGVIRPEQVAVGRRADAAPGDPRIHAARFVPPPPGPQLRSELADLLTWITSVTGEDIDPVVVAAMAHYQFEALHPFQDGNGRIGRLLVVISLMLHGVLSEPTLTVSPWFEARRAEYYDRLFAVSTRGDWDEYIRFFATGIEAAATSTHRQLNALVDVRAALRERVRASSLRADSARQLVDHAVSHPTFTVADGVRALGLSQPRVGRLVEQLVELGILEPLGEVRYARRYRAPSVWEVLLDRDAHP